MRVETKTRSGASHVTGSMKGNDGLCERSWRTKGLRDSNPRYVHCQWSRLLTSRDIRPSQMRQEARGRGTQQEARGKGTVPIHICEACEQVPCGSSCWEFSIPPARTDFGCSLPSASLSLSHLHRSALGLGASCQVSVGAGLEQQALEKPQPSWQLLLLSMAYPCLRWLPLLLPRSR